MGMVGGGQGAFIGGVHRIAAALDGQIELVAGVFSRDWNNTQTTGREPLSRSVAPLSHRRRDGRRRSEAAGLAIASTSSRIVTPNDAHFGPAKAFLEAGFHVVCDKPLTLTLERSGSARDASSSAPGCVFALTHNYTGYPLVRHARQLFRSGRDGRRAEGDRRVPAGLADGAARKAGIEAGVMAHRSRAVGHRRRARRHRHARAQPRRVRHRRSRRRMFAPT